MQQNPSHWRGFCILAKMLPIFYTCLHMKDTQAYAVNDAKVVSETIEGEAIIINLETGTYYSMNETGSLVWDALRSGTPFGGIVGELVARYDATRDVVTASVVKIIESLLTEGIILESGEAAVTSEPSTASERASFVSPLIQRYDDMQEMLLADPIHDVDEAGWPTLKQSNA